MCPIALAISLAPSVQRGHLTMEGARSAIVVATDRGMASGTLDGSGTLAERLHIYVHIMNLHIARRQAMAERADGAIKRVLRPLIEMRAPRNRIMAEAFNANEDAGSPLTEAEVADRAVTLVYWSLQTGART